MKGKRNVYLDMKPLAEARAMLPRSIRPSLGPGLPRRSTTADAVGRILAEPVHARRSAPTYHGSGHGRHRGSRPGIRTGPATSRRSGPRAVGESAVFVNTGEPDARGQERGHHDRARPGVRTRIESASKSLGVSLAACTEGRRGHRRHRDAFSLATIASVRTAPGALLAGGVTSVSVLRRPRVLIIPTGERDGGCRGRGPERDLPPGRIIESNSTVLGKLVEAHGGEFVRHRGVRDDADEIAKVIARGRLDPRTMPCW